MYCIYNDIHLIQNNKSHKINTEKVCLSAEKHDMCNIRYPRHLIPHNLKMSCPLVAERSCPSNVGRPIRALVKVSVKCYWLFLSSNQQRAENSPNH